MSPNQSPLKLSAGQWLGWQEFPARRGEGAIWDCTPVLMTAVQPLKTGKGVLRIGFAAALHPMRSDRRTVDLRVTIHGVDHLAGTFIGGDGQHRTGILELIDLAWIENRCGRFWSRFPVRSGIMPWPYQAAVGPDPSASQYLEQVFGRTAEQIVGATQDSSFLCDKPPMPQRHTIITIGQGYRAFDSFLIARGFRPDGMDDKWFIYLEHHSLIMRRSWTGIMIYNIDVQWRGDELYLGQAVVNRDPDQYGVTDDVADRRSILALIDLFLRRTGA